MSSSPEPTERRSGTDRRATPRNGQPERRKVGRPALPVEAQQQTLHVKVTPALYDAVAKHALRQDVAMNAIVRTILQRALLPCDVA